MYARILVPLEHSDYDDAILAHVSELARILSSSVVLIHVADGWAARNIRHLGMRESEEIKGDRSYIERVATELSQEGLPAEAVLASGDPAKEIADAAVSEKCDLIAMATHGHKLIGDVVYGSVANEVRHRSMVPVLLVRAPAGSRKTPVT